MQLLNHLCLLEPMVGVVWQCVFADAAGVTLELHHHALLFAGLWLVYAGDRWLDVRHELPKTSRHGFAHRHRKPLGRAWLGVLVLALGLASAKLSAAEWVAGLSLVAASAAYMFLVHRSTRVGRVLQRKLFRKEPWVSVIYAAGVGLFIWPNATPGLHFVAAQSMFAGLVLLNLLSIAKLETRVDTLHTELSLAARIPVLTGSLRSITAGFIMLALVLGMYNSPLTPAFWCLAGSAGLLLLLSRFGSHVDHGTGHALSDLALLTPLLGLLP